MLTFRDGEMQGWKKNFMIQQPEFFFAGIYCRMESWHFSRQTVPQVL
jgi:hypothetical protein